MDPSLSVLGNITARLHVHWGHASAQRLKRVMVDSGWGANGLLGCVGDVIQQCEVCRAFGKAPFRPIAGTPLASSFYGKLQADLPFWTTRLPCKRWTCFSGPPFRFWPVSRTLWKCGMTSAACGSLLLVGRHANGWMRAVNAKVGFGQIPVRSARRGSWDG